MDRIEPERPRRRSGTEKRRLSHTTTIRWSPAQFALLSAGAEAAGISHAAYVRKLVANAPVPRRSRRPSADRAELVRILAAIGKPGSNINQLAYVAHTSGIEGVRVELLRKATDDIAEIRAMLMKALGYAPVAETGLPA